MAPFSRHFDLFQLIDSFNSLKWEVYSVFSYEWKLAELLVEFCSTFRATGLNFQVGKGIFLSISFHKFSLLWGGGKKRLRPPPIDKKNDPKMHRKVPNKFKLRGRKVTTENIHKKRKKKPMEVLNVTLKRFAHFARCKRPSKLLSSITTTYHLSN